MREKMMKVSIPLFDEKGYSETSIQDIVDCLGVTKGTFYYYYKNKQELLNDINLNFIEYMLEQQRTIVSNENNSGEDKIYNIIFMVISSIRTRKQHARIFIREMRHMENTNLNEIKQIRKEFKMNIQQLVDDGIKTGEFKHNLNSYIISLGIIGMMNWTYYWYDPAGEVSAEEVANIFMDMIRTGIK